MKLYPIPGGTWAGTEADWKKAMKARGLDPKAFEATKTRDVPTGKPDLLEFLNFFAVDVYRDVPTGRFDIVVNSPVVTSYVPVDVDALRALHNPTAVDLPMQTNADRPAGAGADVFDLDTAFAAAPVVQQLCLAVVAIDAAVAQISKA